MAVDLFVVVAVVVLAAVAVVVPVDAISKKSVGNILIGQIWFGPKIQNCQFKLKFGT